MQTRMRSFRMSGNHITFHFEYIQDTKFWR